MRRFASYLLLVLLSFAACAKREKPKQYVLTGYVVRLDSNATVATIRGDKVEGWMGAMTMDYPVEDKASYLTLRTGEKIRATVNVASDGAYWLSNVTERKGN